MAKREHVSQAQASVGIPAAMAEHNAKYSESEKQATKPARPYVTQKKASETLGSTTPSGRLNRG